MPSAPRKLGEQRHLTLLRNPHWVLLVHFLIALAMVPGLLRLQTDNSPQIFFVEEAGSLKVYQEFKTLFGSGKAIRITISGDDIWNRETLSWLGRLEKNLGEYPEVESALGLVGLHQWIQPEWPPEDPIKFRSHLLSASLDRKAGWVSPDGNTLSLAVVFKEIPTNRLRELLSQLESLLGKAPPGTRISITGLPVLERAMDSILNRTTRTILPALAILAACLLFFLLGNLRDTLSPLIFAALLEGILFGIMGYLKIRLNLVNMVLAILLFVISLATALHILIRFRRLEQQGMHTFEALTSTYRNKKWPILWTSVTTLAAFFSLVTGNIPPIRSIGVWSGVGILLMTLLVFSFYPALLLSFSKSAPKNRHTTFESLARGLGEKIANWSVVKRRLVLLITGILLLFGIYGITHLKVEDNLEQYFPPQNPMRQDLERLEKEQMGAMTAELVLSLNPQTDLPSNFGEQGFQNPAAQQKLAELSARLRRLPLVYGAAGSGDLLETALDALMIEGSVSQNTRWLTLGMLQTAPESRKILQSLLSADGIHARISILLPIRSFHIISPLFKQISQEARALFPKAKLEITGQYPLIVMAQQKLLSGLITSLSITLLAVMAAFFFILHRPSLVLRVIIPNIWPIIMVGGGMAWLKIPLDSSSIMAASIVLGLAVDDTLHSLHHFLRIVPRYDAPEAIVRTLKQTAPAHMLTTFILVAGFTACSFSGFLPVARMGRICTMAIVLALLGDLILIPALLSVKNWNKKQPFGILDS